MLWLIAAVLSAVFAGLTNGINKNENEAVSYRDLCRVIYNAIDLPLVVEELTIWELKHTSPKNLSQKKKKPNSQQG